MGYHKLIRAIVQLGFLLAAFCIIHFAVVPFIVHISLGLSRSSKSINTQLTNNYWASIIGQDANGQTLSNLPKDKLLKVLEPLHFTKPHMPVYQSIQWQVVNDPIYEIYLYSAFYDDRPSLKSRFIRVIAIAEKNAKDLFCLLWYRNRPGKADVVVADIEILSKQYKRHEKLFASYMYKCKIPNGRWPPEYVSLITTESIVPSVLLKVIQPENPPSKHNFGICVPVSYGEFNDHRLVEWFELNKLLGVEKISIYNNSISDRNMKVIKHYHDANFIMFNQLPNVTEDKGDETLFLNKEVSIMDCLYRNIYKYRYIIVAEFDKTIVPHKHMDYEEMLEYINDEHNLTDATTSYTYRNAYFFLDYMPAVDEPNFLITTRFLTRVPASNLSHIPMAMINPMACEILNATKCVKLLPEYNKTGWNINVHENMSLSHHYKLCDFDANYHRVGMCNDTLVKYQLDDTMLNFLDALTQKVIEILWRLELVDLFPLNEDGDQAISLSGEEGGEGIGTGATLTPGTGVGVGAAQGTETRAVGPNQNASVRNFNNAAIDKYKSTFNNSIVAGKEKKDTMQDSISEAKRKNVE